PVPASLDLRGFDPDRAGSDRMNHHGGWAEITTCGTRPRFRLPQRYWSPCFGRLLVDHADVGGDHVPAVGKAHPGLHLAADLAGRAVEERRGDAHVAAVGGDHRARDGAREADRRARRAKARNLRVAVEILTDAVADGARVVAE